MSSKTAMDRRDVPDPRRQGRARRCGRRQRLRFAGRRAGEVSGARGQLDHLSGARRLDRHDRAHHPAVPRKGGDQDHARICSRCGRARCAHEALDRAPRRLRHDDGVRAGRRDRRSHRPRHLQGEPVHPDLRLERYQLADLREEGFADPHVQGSGRRVQEASRRHRHDRPRRIEPHPAGRAAEGIEPAVRHGAFRRFRESLSGGAGRPYRRRHERAGIGLAHERQACISSASPANDASRRCPTCRR